MEIKMTIEQAERMLSEIIPRVAVGNERIVLTSQGKPKVALVSMADYETLLSLQMQDQARLKTWMQTTQALAEEVREKQGGSQVDAEAILDENHNDLEDRNDWIMHHD